jgi:hypothetical protein
MIIWPSRNSLSSIPARNQHVELINGVMTIVTIRYSVMQMATSNIIFNHAIQLILIKKEDDHKVTFTDY